MGTSRNRFAALLLICGILAVHVGLSTPSPASGFSGDLLPIKPGCSGSIGECLATAEDEVEFQMDTETNRRTLATRQYISYGALRRNSIPCSRRGASYYNCRAGAQANPYSRGCSAITRCRR